MKAKKKKKEERRSRYNAGGVLRIEKDRGYGSKDKDKYRSYTPFTKSRVKVLLWIQKNGEQIK